MKRKLIKAGVLAAILFLMAEMGIALGISRKIRLEGE